MMKAKSYKIAGWAAVLAVTAFVLEIVLTLASKTPTYTEAISPALVALALMTHVLCAGYATYCLRSFLNERYEFHGADSLIPLLVGGGIVFALALVGSMFLFGPVVSMVLQLSLGIPLGVISMFFGYRLIAVNGKLGGFKKPLAYSHILAPLCFMSVILAPVGLLLLLLAGTLLALIFFNDDSAELEFV